MTSQQNAGTCLGTRVDEMLLDAGAAGDTELRAALLSLGSLAELLAPAPSGDLAKLIAAAGSPSGFSGDAPDELARRRRRRNFQRPTLLGIALIAGMGTGIGGVAASSPAPGPSGSLSVQALLADWSPSWSLTAQPLAAGMPTPAATESADVAGQQVQAAEPGPVATSMPLPVPATPGAAGQPPATPEPAAGRPAAGPAQPVQVPSNNGGKSGGKDAPTAPGRGAADPPAATGGGAGQTGPALPAGPGGPAGAGENGLPGNLVKPLAEAVRPVVGAVAGNPAPLESWLQKFTR